MRRALIGLPFAALLLWTAAAASDPQLSVSVDRNLWRVNEAGTLRFDVALESGRLRAGSRLGVVVPGSWIVHAFHSYEDADGNLRANQPYSVLTGELAAYARLEDGAPARRWSLAVVEASEDGTYHRFSRTFVFTLEQGSLDAGERVRFEYGTAAKPIRASFLAERVRFPVRFDPGDGKWRELSTSPRVQTRAGAAKELVVTAAAQAVVDSAARFHVTARDEFGNPAILPASLAVRGSDSAATIEIEKPSGRRSRSGFVRFPDPGFHSVEAGADGLGVTVSNPIRVSQTEPKRKLYWGDLHSHSSMSKDGIGETPFRFARDYSDLDFYASSEHSSGDRNDIGVTDEEWRRTTAAVQSFYEPGRFVTILGYECSLGYPYGHHNVYFADDEAPLYRTNEVRTLPELWRRLKGRRAFTVPHHTGIAFGGGSGKGAGVSWDGNDPLRPLIEIYSGHGQSEYFDRNNPLSYDNLVFVQRWKDWFQRQAPGTPEEYRDLYGPSSAPGPHYARDAWAQGLSLGVIASSDDHTARPGQPSKGLVAVWAERLDRESIFDALLNRRSYGTTGQRIYLDFHVNKSMSGERVRLDEPPSISVEAAASGPIEWVEVVRLDKNAREFTRVRRWRPDSSQLLATVTDRDYREAGLYYVRLKQEGTVGGRPILAWSTPIWVR